MDPVTNKLLQGTPYAGMGGTQERNALIGVIRNLISEDKYTVDYILNYAQSVGYQRQMAEDVFKELTGLSPKLIVNNNEYYNMPSYVPNMCIAWGTSKSNKEKAFYIVPFEYGYAVMEKDEVNAPIPTVISATIPEAFEELKKVAKGIQTLDKIITKKLLETEDVQTDAHTVHQVNLPYAASPLQILKNNFKDKILSVSEFERQASKLLASEEITVDEAEDLMAWKQDLIDEDETYGNDVLELDEQWKPLDAEVDDDDFNGYHSSEEYLNSYEYLYETLVNGNITLYKEKLNKLSKSELMDYIAWAEEMGIGREELKLHYITASKKMATFDNVKYSLNDALIILKNNGLEYKDLEEVKETSSNPKEMKQALSTAIERIKNSGIDAEESLKGYTEDLNNTSDEFVSFPKTENEMKELYNRLLNDEVLQFNTMEQLFIGASKQKIDEGTLYLYYRGYGQYAVDPTYENFKRLVNRIKNKKSASKKQSSSKEDFDAEVDNIDNLISYYSTRLNEFIDDYYGDNAAMQSEVDYDFLNNHSKELFNAWKEELLNNTNSDEWSAAEKAYYNLYDGRKTASKKVISESVSVKDLEQRAKHYEDLLKEEGYTDMKVSPNFAYGQYGYYFDWTRADGKSGQKYTGLGTKKETLKNLELAYYELVNKIDWFMKRKSANSNLNDSIKQWYTKTYKTDECGADINPNTTFMEVLSDAENAYDLIGVTDSVVRERVFDELSKRTNIPYEKICDMWMGKQASKKVKSNNKDIVVIDTGNGYLQVFENDDTYNYGGHQVGEQLYEFSINDEDRNNGKATLDVDDLLNNKFYGIIFKDFDKLEWFVQNIKDSNSKEEIKRLLTKEAKTIYSSKKVTAENMTLDDIEAEDNKDQVQEEIEKIDETPAEDIFTESTPEQYLDKALQEDKVDTINDVVSKCIDKFSEKFKDFDKYQVKILSYNTKVLGDDKPVQEEMVEDKELNANAILQVILQITNNSEEANIKKVLAVFSITNGELHWTGTVRGENDQVVAFTEEGLDSLFEVDEPSEEELEDII